jgi:hypothetical protein
MASRTNSKYDSEQRVKVDEPLEEPSTVRLVKSQYPARILYKGIATGNWYEWAGAGAIVPVDALDVDDLLSKQMNRQPCCNSINMPQSKFVEVKCL